MGDQNKTAPQPLKTPAAPHKAPQPIGSEPKAPTPGPAVKPAKPIPPGAPIR